MTSRGSESGHPAFDAPNYGAAGLSSVLPSVAASLGVPPNPHAPDVFDASGVSGASGALADPDAGLIALPAADRAVVVLVDGLGERLLARRGGHAPFLRGLVAQGHRLTCGFPSTTATSMGTFGTGLPPGAHGLVGYEVLDPRRDLTFNELSWENGPDPRQWQPAQTVFERAAAAGVTVTMIGPNYFEGSGLTTAALRGAHFRGARDLAGRVEEALAALRESPRALVYLYWGELDKVGHVRGCDSWQWGDELEAIDRALSQLAQRLPRGTALHVTADHGMVDVPHENRLDIAHEPVLSAGVRHVAGEARAVQLFCQEGAIDDVVAAWRGTLGDRAWVLPRAEVERLGWFGPISSGVRPRIGEIVVAMRDLTAVVDSRSQRPELISLLGLHGSLTDDEIAVPLLSVAPS